MKRTSMILMLLALATSWAYADVTFHNVTNLLPNAGGAAGTVAWGDVNSDGNPDLFVGGLDAAAGKLYLNVNGTFLDATGSYAIPDYCTRRIRSAEFLDYNNDGRLDLFLLTNDTHGLWLLRQTSNAQFVPVNVLNGTSVNGTIRGAVWTDVDQDGYLDLVISNVESAHAPMVVIQQAEHSEFVEMRDNPWENDLSGVGVISLMDFDRDGDQDIFFGSYDPAFEPRFYRNEGDDYTDLSERFGMRPKLGATGVAWADFDNDQRMDMFVPDYLEHTALFEGVNVNGEDYLAYSNGVRSIRAVMQPAKFAHAVDVDMNGWPDLFLVNQSGNGCQLLLNTEGEHWVDVARAAQLPVAEASIPGPTVISAAWADYDRDGDMDVAIAQGADGVQLYSNVIDNHPEFIALQLYEPYSQIPLSGVNVTMVFERCKRIATTSPASVGSGYDDRTIILANYSEYKSDRAELVIDWPGNTRQVIDLSELTLNNINMLYRPSSSEMAEAAEPQQPLEVADYSISPNPFNPTTTISFTLNEAADVQLKLYNLVGQEVAVLANQPYTAGVHRVAFNGSNLPSGIYFSRLTAGSVTEMKRMLLTK